MNTRDGIEPYIQKVAHQPIRDALAYLADELDLLRLQQDETHTVSKRWDCTE